AVLTARGPGRVRVAAAARGGVRGGPGGARGAVPARRAAEGAAGAAAGAGPLARGAGRRAGRAAPAPRAVGRLGPRRGCGARRAPRVPAVLDEAGRRRRARPRERSEEHTSELQSPCNLVCRLLLEKKNSTAPMVGGVSEWR